MFFAVALWAVGLGGVARAHAAPQDPAVKVGLEVLEAEKAASLKGRKVGLVAHPASVTASGRHALDVLRNAGVDVVRILAPERALRTRGAAWDKVSHNLDGTPWNERPKAPAQTWVDIETGLPIVGLFSDQAWLKADDLKGLDVLVFDLQDAGTRLFTNSGLLVLAIDAAAAAGVELVVLDRPNPLGGERVEGPAVAGSGPKAARLTHVAPGPLVPGVTLGELAQIANARRDKPARLRVVAMKGWRRSMLWPDTGRAWPVPSPNLRSFEAALAYAGVSLLEATTLSEGRGTETPFQLLGAPGLSLAPLLALSVPGFGLAQVKFTPRPSASAMNPKHANHECGGVRVDITQPRAARPYQLGIALLRATHGQPSFQWRSPTALDELLGSPKVRLALERGDSVASIVGADAEAIEAFKKERARALLY
jgi:uncharacterized protein YbbC (DUF1343 family)